MESILSHFPAGYWDRVVVRVVEGAVELLRVFAAYLVIRWIICQTTRRVVRRVGRLDTDAAKRRRVETLAGLARSASLYALAIITGILALRAVGVDPTPLLTAAGVAGLAVGFGAQKLVRDVMSGSIILLENQFAVDETVTIAGVTGVVTEVGLRTTRIRDSQGRTHIFSNGDISAVCNHSRQALTTPLDVSFASSVDLAKAKEALDAAGAEVSSRHGLESPFVCRGIASFDAGKVTLSMHGKVSPRAQEQVFTDLREAVLRYVREAGLPLA